MAENSFRLNNDLRHPDSLFDSNEWYDWRLTFEGGVEYRDRYLNKWSDRETDEQFRIRRHCTPIPTFAKAAILDIRNSIFQRLSDISRIGGSSSYQAAMRGENGGVDRKGSSMNSFIGLQVLTELLLMGRVGIYVDAPSVVPTSLAETARAPYLYVYQIEDILSWTLESEENPGQFKAVLLRDHSLEFDVSLGVELPSARATRYRLVWKDDTTGKVHVRMMNENKETIFMPGSREDGSIMLDIEEVPFIMPNIGDSLMKDIWTYQNALLNTASADVMWAITSNAPFLTIQQDLRTAGSHLKRPSHTSAEPGAQPGQGREERVGSGKGRYYDKDMDRPDFIAPPTAPLIASMQLQEKLEDDIRKLVNLAVTNKAGSRTESAESKKLSSQGLEAGLSFIGLVMQQVERLVASTWASYENPSNPKPASISYPNRYILKSDMERLDESDKILDLADRIPSRKMKKHLQTLVATVLLSGRETSEEIDSAAKEIQAAGFTTTDVTDVLAAHAAGLVSDELASQALGYPDGEIDKAREDRAIRNALTLIAQTSPGEAPVNPASRGVPDMDMDPESGKKEQSEHHDGDKKPSQHMGDM